MDKIDKQILNLMERNARISFQEIGNAIGMSRVAAKKRVQKLERTGIIRGYNTYICSNDSFTLLLDVYTVPDGICRVLECISDMDEIRQVFLTTKENHLHIVAVSDSLKKLKELTLKIHSECKDVVSEIHSHAVKEVLKDVYGGIDYGQKSGSDDNGDNEQH